MKRHLRILLFLAACLLLGEVKVNAQTLTLSPYSRFGLGEPQKDEMCQNTAMAGAAQGFHSPVYINLANPASLGAIRFTTFQAAALGQTSLLESDTTRQWTRAGSFSNLSFAFPVAKWWGTGFGLRPYSNSKYDVSTTATDPVAGEITYTYKGSGGLNEAYFVNGFMPIKNLYIGAKAGFIFGRIKREKRVVFDDQIYYFNTKSNQVYDFSGFAYQGGLQYTIPFGKDKGYSLTLGGSGGFGNSLQSTRSTFVQTFKLENNIDKIRDTVYYSQSEKGSIQLPDNWTGGFSLKKGEKWMICGDYGSRAWSNYSTFGQNDSLMDASTISIGGQFVPNTGYTGKFFERTQYRAGIKYSGGFLKLRGNPVSETAITLGAGVPLKRTTSTFNFAVELGQMGSLDQGLIRDRYIRLHLAVTLNDIWFIKRRID